MTAKFLSTTLLLAALCMTAALLPQAAAACCCGAGQCTCCCSRETAPQDNLLPSAPGTAGGTCTCSRGQLPSGAEQAVFTASENPKHQRYAATAATFSPSRHGQGATSVDAADRPPPSTAHCLYILHSALLI